MSTLDADSMHRLAKMALDLGEVSSPEEALELFSRYRIHIHLGGGWAETFAGQACFLTALNTAARAFLGGIEISGDLSPALGVPLYEGQHAHAVAQQFGGVITQGLPVNLPTLVLGDAPAGNLPDFCIQLSWDGWCASVSPLGEDYGLTCASDNPLAGIAAGALGVNEAFMHVREELPEAGHRAIGISLWNPLAITDWRDEPQRGPVLQYLPKALWLVGLGHLGQAYAWTLAMLPYPIDGRPHLVLQDFDKAAKSNLSTCMLLSSSNLGQTKVRHVAERLEAAGFNINLVERRFGPSHQVMADEPTTALIGVDNVTTRRDLESAGFSLVVEAGLGSGYRDFRNIRMHTFPGPRRPSDIWAAEAAAQMEVNLNAAYSKLAQERNDLCGMTQLASRAVATPFVGALAGALVLSEVMRPLHGGKIHAVLDLQMKSLAYRTGAEPVEYGGLSTPYVRVARQEPTVVKSSEYGEGETA